MTTPATKDDVTEDELKLLGTIRTLGIKPEGVDTKEKFETYIHKYDVKPVVSTTEKKPNPRISTFFGEENKGDVTYSKWRYEIRCLVEERSYSEETLLLAIRRAVRGEAADILRRIGIKASVGEILSKFHSIYGQIDSVEVVLKKFYACEQGEKESFTKYCARVEELFMQAVELNALKPTQEKVLMGVVYQGMQQPLKQLSALKFEKTSKFDEFKIEVRKLESEQQKEKASTPKCMSNTASKSEFGEIKDLLKDMNSRLHKLEEDKEQQQQQSQHLLQQQVEQLLQQQQQQQQQPYFYQPRGTYRGPRYQRGNFTQNTQQTRGRGQYRPARPTAFNNFRPQTQTYNNYNTFRCFKCNKEGHKARFSPEN